MPHISVSQKSYVGEVGHLLTLSVVVTGHDKVTWMKDGRALDINHHSPYVVDRHGSLHITQVASLKRHCIQTFHRESFIATFSRKNFIIKIIVTSF